MARRWYCSPRAEIALILELSDVRNKDAYPPAPRELPAITCDMFSSNFCCMSITMAERAERAMSGVQVQVVLENI
jgi:hypothetical protein